MTTVRTQVLRSPKTNDIATSGSVQFRAPYDQTAPDGTTICKGLVTDPIALVGGKLPDTDIAPGDYEVKIKVENVTRRDPQGQPWFPITVGSSAVDLIVAIAAFTQWTAPVVSAAQAAAQAAAASAAAAATAAQRLDAVVAGAPTALDTLDELAAALGDDANFAATVTTALNARPTKAAADAAYARTKAPFFARRDDIIPGVYGYFGDRPNAYSAAPLLDSGHQTTYAGTAPSVVSGAVTCLGSGPRASYIRIPDLGVNVTRVGARFFFVPGSGTRTGGGTACIAVANGLIDPANITVDMACHFYTTSTAWAFTVWLHGSGQTVLPGCSGTYATPLAVDARTEYEMQAWLDGTTATFDLPDGSRRTVQDQRIADYAGRYPFFEPYLPNGDTDDLACFRHYWADTGPIRIPRQAIDKTTADAVYAPRWQPNETLTAGTARLLPIARVGTFKANGTTGLSFDATKWNYPRLTFTGSTSGAPTSDIPGATTGDIYVDSTGAEYTIASS